MAKRRTTKLRNLGRRKSKTEIKRRVEKAMELGKRRQYDDLRLEAKRANERMRQLEKAGLDSPAYQAIQARLEILGKSRKGTRGRRFSESGRATYAEYEILKKILKEFLYEQTTSTVKGARNYYDEVWASANKNNNLADAGISRDEWFKFWENMPSDKKDRLYGSSQIVNIVQAYTIRRDEIRSMSDSERKELVKSGEISRKDLNRFLDNKFSVEDIADEIRASKNLKNAYKRVGISYKDVKKARVLGSL